MSLPREPSFHEQLAPYRMLTAFQRKGSSILSKGNSMPALLWALCLLSAFTNKHSPSVITTGTETVGLFGASLTVEAGVIAYWALRFAGPATDFTNRRYHDNWPEN